MKVNEVDRKEGLDYLRPLLQPGQKIYTSVVKVNRNGDSRHIKLYLVKDNSILDITRWVALAEGYKRNPNTGGIIVGGGGMNMCFMVVYSLGKALYPDGVPCTGNSSCTLTPDGRERCQSNDHVNGSKDYTIGHLHRDGGYAFREISL